jgi:hypothetical protein
MARLKVSELRGDSHVTREDGARLLAWVERHWSQLEPLSLDFADLRVASASFFDESLGTMAARYPLQELSQRIQVENIDPGDRILLNQLVSSRSAERERRGMRAELADKLRLAGVPDETLETWDGSPLALYQSTVALSGSADTSELSSQRASLGEWTLDLGHAQMGLSREAGVSLRTFLDERGVPYVKRSLGREWRGRRRQSA